jgi:hypothetical protein
VVSGGARRRLQRLRTPEPFGSLRRLRPFRVWTRPPPGVPLLRVLRHTRALVQLHPDRKNAHLRVCQWLAQQLTHARGNRAPGQPGGKRDGGRGTFVLSSSANAQLDYKVRTREQVIRARAIESRLVVDYLRWLESQHRVLQQLNIGGLRCDGFEEARLNLIEAKNSDSLEHIRMAVGQLFDYAYRMRHKYPAVRRAILLPR